MNNDNSKATTTDGGIPVASDEHSLTVGPDGPILLQDHYLIEQMANFNRDVGHLKKGVSAPVLTRAFEYWRNIDKEIGDRIARGMNTD